jgi:hypothetical protein
MTAPACRSSMAATNSGRHCDTLSVRSSGERVTSPRASSSNIISGRISSFCTPDGAIRIWRSMRSAMPPPVPLTQPRS